jgi:hypothetical protein
LRYGLNLESVMHVRQTTEPGRYIDTAGRSGQRLASLRPKQLRFIDEYLIDMNGTAAAVRAGYSAKCARSIATENLSKPALQADGFAERRFQYANLGLRGAALASKLRMKIALPNREISEWDPLEHLASVKLKIETCRAKIARRHAETMSSVNV